MILTTKSQLAEKAASRESDSEKKHKTNEELTNYRNQITALNAEISELEDKCQKFLHSLLNRNDLNEQTEKVTADQADLKQIKEQIDYFRENIEKKILALEDIYNHIN